MEIKGKHVLVIGLARSGVAAARLLASLGADVTVNDAKAESALAEALAPLAGLPVKRALGCPPDELVPGKDFIVVSPGVPTELPYKKIADELGIPVLAEAELGYRLAPCPMVAITGTNGKTTTTTLVGKIFEKAGYTTHVVGNIGLPITEAVPQMKPEDVIVMEVSSFMMETADTFRPRVSAILNITEDHLNRHHTMEVYTDMKCRIFANQRDDDVLVLNYDQEETRILASRAKCRVLFFSHEVEVEAGVCLSGEYIVYRPGDGTEVRLGRPGEIRLPGRHNLENALAATAMTMAMGVNPAAVRHTLATFEGVEHRIERVTTVSGVTFFNDSKGTNVDAALRAVWSMEAPTVLIAGGYDKHTDFMPLFEGFTDQIRHVILIGDTAQQLADTAEKAGYTAISRAGTFREAVEAAYALGKPGWNVLLSPACASFDMFKDYEERGRIFKEIVRSLKEKEA